MGARLWGQTLGAASWRDAQVLFVSFLPWLETREGTSGDGALERKPRSRECQTMSAKGNHSFNYSPN